MLAALDALIETPARTALLMDFDGTLAAIVDHPGAAAPVPGVVPLLRSLVARFGVVGIVSGRPVAFLREALPVDGLAFVGQYGMEHWDGTQVVVDQRTASYHALIAEVGDRAVAEFPTVLVERKGEVAVTLHFREHPDLEHHVRRWADVTATEMGLVPYPTRMAVELRPPIRVDKGEAAAGLVAGMEAAMFAGDDHGDIAAFDALDALRAGGALARVVRVAASSLEAPIELVRRADLVVDGPAGVVEFLTQLIAAVEQAGESQPG